MTDHFERLGLPRRFPVDLAAAEREYLARSRAVHPDFHQLGSAAEQRASLELSAALNEAYSTLKDPARRAEYLLALHGGPTAQQAKDLDQAFLMEMLDLRERIEQARASADRAGVAAIEGELAAMQADRVRQAAGLFDRLDELPLGHPDRPRVMAEIRRGLNAVKTIQSLLRDLRLD
ncbi:MAG TPA: Fe-S protein assembly co-chaperone HscB [Fimbriiglobus sp.]|nr:Fe-S protein assembly co-chaperone HscB [Fimbriiglobus sp.]